MNTTIARRLGVLAAGASLALGALAPAQAATSPSAGSAAFWLLGELPAENYYSYSGGTFANTGLTIDAAFAGVATGNTALVNRTTSGVAATVGEYTSFESSVYANSTAKALAFATRAGANPRSLGGRDLVAQLEALVRPNGRVSDSDAIADPANDDFANVLGQGFAAEGLSAVGSPKAASVVSYLQGLQCGSGAFGFDLPAAGAAPTCTDPSANPGADTTSLVGTSLARLTPTASVNASVDRAASFLVATGPSGAFGGATGSDTAGVNSNSTGLAASLLGASCRVAAADQAADRVRSFQLANGAVAYDQAAFTAGQSAGVTSETQEQFRLSTTQATTGLVWDASAPASITLTGPTTAVPAGSAQTLTVTGVAKGETLCLTTPAGVTRLVGTGAPLAVPVTAPATGTAAYFATTGPGTAAKTVVVKPSATVNGKKFSPGDKVKVKLTGLTKGKKIAISVRGQKVKTTKAKGTADKVSFRLAKRIKPGKATVKIKTGGQVVKVKIKIAP